MKKKLKHISIIVALAAFGMISANFSVSDKDSNLTLVLDNVEALASSSEGGSGALYQTMAYCTPGNLTWACTSKKYAERCQKYACIVDF